MEKGRAPDGLPFGHPVAVVVIGRCPPEIRSERPGDKLFFPIDKGIDRAAVLVYCELEGVSFHCEGCFGFVNRINPAYPGYPVWEPDVF